MSEANSNPAIARLNSEMGAVKEDVATLVVAINDINEKIDQKFEDVIRTLDNRGQTGKQNTLTIIGIILPVVLAIGGILWALIGSVDDRVRGFGEVHLRLQYESGYSAAKVDARDEQLKGVMRRIERLELQKMGE